MSTFLQQFINGLMLGSLYALIALGYTMVYGIIELINFAHGDALHARRLRLASSCWSRDHSASAHDHPPMPCSDLLPRCPHRDGRRAASSACVIERFAYRPLRQAPRLAAADHGHRRLHPAQNVAQAIYGSNRLCSPTCPRFIDPAAGQVVHRRRRRDRPTSRCSSSSSPSPLMIAAPPVRAAAPAGPGDARHRAGPAHAARLMGVNVDRTDRLHLPHRLGDGVRWRGGLLRGRSTTSRPHDDGLPARPQGLHRRRARRHRQPPRRRPRRLPASASSRSFGAAYLRLRPAVIATRSCFIILILILVFKPVRPPRLADRRRRLVTRMRIEEPTTTRRTRGQPARQAQPDRQRSPGSGPPWFSGRHGRVSSSRSRIALPFVRRLRPLADA